MTASADLAKDPVLDERKTRARAWFESLRGRICQAFEGLEDSAPVDLYPGEPGRFTFKPWSREEGGGGVMGMMHGRLFEKVGVHVSTVHGTFTPEFAKTMPGAEEDPRFFATGVSLIAHMRSPRVPAVHMNTRYICTTKGWFGGGGDLTPLLDYQRHQDFPDAVAFHAAMQAACDAHDPAWHAKDKAWCDEYFFLPHRNEPRGVGGIFSDHLECADEAAWEANFAFTQRVGEAFLAVFPRLVRRRMGLPFTPADKAQQLEWRGRYAEFNLVYDRGTLFGLKTGGNIDAILMSLPPEATWG